MKKVCIITGGSGGIGREVVKKFYANDYDIAMVDLHLENMEAVIEECGFDKERVIPFPTNISKEDDVKATIAAVTEKFGRVDALVNTAGILGEYAETIDYTFDNFRKIYEVNVFGTFLMMKYTLPVMVEQHSGAIVNFGSVSGMTGYTFEIGYGSSKWAVIGMTKNVANEYAKHGIRANSVAPGWVNTNMFTQSVADYGDLGQDGVNMGPMGRVAEPAEIANAVYFLCSDEASYINSTNLLVDGGMMLG